MLPVAGSIIAPARPQIAERVELHEEGAIKPAWPLHSEFHTLNKVPSCASRTAT
jgi:hypothetical protein